MNNPSLAQRLLEWVNDPSYRPSKPRAIQRELKLSDDEYRELRRIIKSLVKAGLLEFGSNHLVYAPKAATSPVQRAVPTKELALPEAVSPEAAQLETSSTGDGSSISSQPISSQPISSQPISNDSTSSKSKRESNRIVGIFRRSFSEAYGFVEVPRGTGIAMPDVFIPPSCTKNAMDGDTVAVRVRDRDRRGKVEGEIVEVVARARREFTGTFLNENGKSFVWIDGAKLDSPVEVGDIRGLPLETNDKVIVEMVRYPDDFHPGEAVILKVLGSLKNPAVDTLAVIHQYGLPEEFPNEVIEDARAQADRFNEDVIPPERRDLTAVPTLTIDPVDARDFDDAISLSRNEKGNWELLVHIADVAFFVPVGTKLDDEAQKRGNSVYLPDRVIPMLPETISNHLASLQPDRRRLAKTVHMEYSPDGVLLHNEVYNSVIRNAHRFNYEQIDQYLENREPWKERLAPAIFDLVANMHALAMVLRSNRKRDGSIELTIPEVKIDLDRLGKVKGAHVVAYTESHQIIEEFMLAANQAVAKWLDSLQLPFLRRAHAPPDRLKMRRLTEFMKALGLYTEDMQDRFEIQRVVDSVKGQTTEYAVNFAILKSMSKAVYQCEFERHYALNMSHYCHFTSPIRRYPDLVVHRIVEKLIHGQSAKENPEVLERLGQHCSNTEQTAENAERELVRVKLLHYFDRRVGELLTGIVSGVRSAGLTVRGVEIPVDGLIPVEQLPKDRYHFDRETHTLEGYRSGNRFRLGDELIVRIEKVDLARRQLFFRLEKIVHHSIPSVRNTKRGSKSDDSKSTASKSASRWKKSARRKRRD
jgi:ribonuclease R